MILSTNVAIVILFIHVSDDDSNFLYLANKIRNHLGTILKTSSFFMSLVWRNINLKTIYHLKTNFQNCSSMSKQRIFHYFQFSPTEYLFEKHKKWKVCHLFWCSISFCIYSGLTTSFNWIVWNSLLIISMDVWWIFFRN